MQTIYLAGGCFWGLQKYMDQFEGIENTEVGYATGIGAGSDDFGVTEEEGAPPRPKPERHAPTYEEVCAGSGHAETVKIDFDESKISLNAVLRHDFEVIDPTSVNKQGNDVGVQYRTGIYYIDDAQIIPIAMISGEVSSKIEKPLAVEIARLREFYPAEEYHQKYLDKNPGGYCHIPSSFFQKA